MKTLFILSLFLIPGFARAEYSFSCGKDRDLGVKKAEAALSQDPGSLEMKMLLAGKELVADSYKVTGRSGGYYVSVFGKGDTSTRYEFREKPASVKVFQVARGKDKAAGVLPCRITDTPVAE
jgi:hypothetical protein